MCISAEGDSVFGLILLNNRLAQKNMTVVNALSNGFQDRLLIPRIRFANVSITYSLEMALRKNLMLSP